MGLGSGAAELLDGATVTLPSTGGGLSRRPSFLGGGIAGGIGSSTATPLRVGSVTPPGGAWATLSNSSAHGKRRKDSGGSASGSDTGPSPRTSQGSGGQKTQTCSSAPSDAQQMLLLESALHMADIRWV